MVHDELIYWIWLSLRVGAASTEFVRLLDYYDGIFDLYRAEGEELSGIEGVSPTLVNALSDKSLVQAGKYYHFCQSYHIGILTYNDPLYPTRLREISNPPVLLYYKGELPDLNTVPSISVVGTRKMSEYGKQMAYKISYELASAGIVVVSGMALGVDGVASCGAIEAGGRSIAVLGCGIDVTYPREHSKLMDMIVNNGAVLTEYAPGTRPEGRNFPVRNRIISALSEATLVVEGDSNSGSLITARHALIQGREVFALPGNIDESNAQGTNILLQNGATMIVCAEDIMKQYRKVHKRSLNELAFNSARHSKTDCDRALAKMKVCARIYGHDYSNARSSGGTNELKDAQSRSLVARATVPDRGKPKIAEAAPDVSTPAAAPTAINTPVAARSDKPVARESNAAKLTEVQSQILEAFPLDDCISFDKLVQTTGLAVQVVTLNLTMMTVVGVIRALPGGMYQRL